MDLIETGEDNVPDLLTDQLCLASLGITLPLTNEQLTKEGVQRLLLATKLLTTTAVLLVQSSQEPFEDKKGPLLRIRLLGGGHEHVGVFGPVGRVLGKGGRG